MMKEETDDRKEADGGAMNLESILIATGEMDHLAALLRHRAQGLGGTRPVEMVQDVIHPLLDDLEAEIRARPTGTLGMEELRGVISAWIDRKMKESPDS